MESINSSNSNNNPSSLGSGESSLAQQPKLLPSEFAVLLTRCLVCLTHARISFTALSPFNTFSTPFKKCPLFKDHHLNLTPIRKQELSAATSDDCLNIANSMPNSKTVRLYRCTMETMSLNILIIVRLGLRTLEKEYDRSEEDIKALQSVGQVIGEVLKQLDDERCKSSTLSPTAYACILIVI